MNFLKNNYSQIICLIIGALSGFFFYHVSTIKFEEKVSWISFATFLLTIVLALYLEFRVRPSISNDRIEKDLLIDQLKVIRESANKIYSLYVTIKKLTLVDSTSKSELIQKFRDTSNEIDLFKQTIEHCSTAKKTTVSKDIFIAFLQFKKNLTGYKFDDVNFFYDSKFWARSDSKYKSLIKTLQHSIIDVNRI